MLKIAAATRLNGLYENWLLLISCAASHQPRHPRPSHE